LHDEVIIGRTNPASAKVLVIRFIKQEIKLLKNVKPFNIKTELEVIQFLEIVTKGFESKKPGGLRPDLVFTI
jgi:hypothetical protein